LYLLPNGTILGSSVPPIAPYFGAAISLSGGRYLGSVLLSTAGLIVPFAHFGNKIRYMSSPANAPFRAINGSSNGVSTTVSLTALLPTTARIAHARALNGATGQAYIGNPDMGATSTTNYMTTLRPNTEAYVDLLTDATQNISWYSNGSQTLFLDVMGYEFER
jgi:hypothetical protein